MNTAVILALLQALPELMKTLPRVLDLIERYLSWSKNNDTNQWLNDMEASLDALKQAQTTGERLDALHRVLSSIATLR